MVILGVCISHIIIGIWTIQILGLNNPKLQSNLIKSRKKITNEIEKESNINTNDTE